MRNKKSEVIIIRNRGGKLVEVRIVPYTRKQEKTDFASDNVTEGSMETRPIPERFNSLIDYLERGQKTGELEKMLKFVFR